MRYAVALALGLGALVASACAAPTSDDSAAADQPEIRQSFLEGTWRLSGTTSGSLSGLELSADRSYLGEIMPPCDPNARGCEGVAIRGTWDYKPMLSDRLPWGTLTLHSATTRFTQPGNVPHPIDLVFTLTQKSNSTIAFDQAGDPAPLAFVFGNAAIHATLKKDETGAGFCATSADCADADLLHVELACNGSYKKTCTADRKCAFPCLAADVAGYGDLCGLVPGGNVRKTCFSDPGAQSAIVCDDSMAGSFGTCRVSAAPAVAH